jgi:DNA-binding SARP family transcriptional activator
MRFLLLGPFAIEDESAPVRVTAGRESALLALLLVYRGEALANDRIVDELWGETSPENATKSVQIYVSRLRKSLGAGRIETTPAGYRIRLDPGELDVERFEQLTAAGRREEALALWRGEPLADFRYAPFAQGEARRLEELHRGLVADRIDERLDVGETPIAELEAAIARDPLWERPRGQLMRALYLAGRQADALELYRHTRELLTDQLGIEPGPELQRLERAILLQDPELVVPRSSRSAVQSRGLLRRIPPGGSQDQSLDAGRRVPNRPRRRSSSRRRWLDSRLVQLAVLSTVLLALAASAAGARWLMQGPAPVTVVRNSVAAVDPQTDRVVADVLVGDRPTRLVAGGGDIWSFNEASRTVSRIDETGQNGVRTFAIGHSPVDVAFGAGALWTAEAGGHTLEKIDPASGETIGSVTPRIPSLPATRDGGDVAFGSGAVWFGSNHSTVTRVNPTTLRVERTVRNLDVGPGGQILAGPNAVWIDNSFGNITQLDPSTNQQVGDEISLATANVGGIAAGADVLWATAIDEGLVWEIDAQQIAPIHEYPVGSDPIGVAVGAGSVWIANAGGTLTRLNPANGQTRTIHLGYRPNGVEFANNLVWVAID